MFLSVVLTTVSCAMALAFMRVLLGPSAADRVAAVDLLVTLAVGLMAMYAVATEQPLFLDLSLVLALLSFLSTAAFSYFIEREKQ
jgi:multicomponent Na+:H+ antiporter subunit F